MQTKEPPVKSPETLDDWLVFISRQHVQAIDLGLERVLIVFRRLFPRGLPGFVVTVAGTNGKGSTVRLLESLLQASGRTTGAYLSPHLHRYNERVRILGQEATDQALIEAFRAVESARQKIPLTYFEFGTLVAFWLFAQARPDVLLLEVGLGGRLDAVNLIDPDIAVITSIDLDHQEWLGHDRNRIGFEKAGIFRPGIQAIYGETDPPPSIRQQAVAQQINLQVRGQHFDLAGDDWWSQTDEQSARFTLPVADVFKQARTADIEIPPDSLANALQVCRLMGLTWQPAALATSLRHLRIPGRFECVSQDPLIILDVAHNPHAAHWLQRRLAARYPDHVVYAVYACLADKDAVGVVDALKSSVNRWYFAGLAVPRGETATSLKERLGAAEQTRAIAQQASFFSDVQQALRAAETDRLTCDKAALILVFGSFYTVAIARDDLAHSVATG